MIVKCFILFIRRRGKEEEEKEESNFSQQKINSTKKHNSNLECISPEEGLTALTRNDVEIVSERLVTTN